MSIQKWLETHSEQVDADPAIILKAMSEAGTPRRNQTLWTWAMLANKFGRGVIGKISAILDTVPSLKWVNTSLANGGLDFSAQQFQEGVDELVAKGVLEPDIGASLKLLGATPRTAWAELTGLTDLPTADAIKDAQAAFHIELQRELVRLWAHNTWTGVVQPAVQGGSTIQEIKALIAATE